MKSHVRTLHQHLMTENIFIMMSMDVLCFCLEIDLKFKTAQINNVSTTPTR